MSAYRVPPPPSKDDAQSPDAKWSNFLSIGLLALVLLPFIGLATGTGNPIDMGLAVVVMFMLLAGRPRS